MRLLSEGTLCVFFFSYVCVCGIKLHRMWPDWCWRQYYGMNWVLNIGGEWALVDALMVTVGEYSWVLKNEDVQWRLAWQKWGWAKHNFTLGRTMLRARRISDCVGVDIQLVNRWLAARRNQGSIEQFDECVLCTELWSKICISLWFGIMMQSLPMCTFDNI